MKRNLYLSRVRVGLTVALLATVGLCRADEANNQFDLLELRVKGSTLLERKVV